MTHEMMACGWCGGHFNDCDCNAADGRGQRNFDAAIDGRFYCKRCDDWFPTIDHADHGNCESRQ